MREALFDEIEALVPAMRRFARSLTRDAFSADDLVQDTLERALTRLDQFEPGTNIKAWLFTIMRNRFISDCRRRSARPEVESDEDQEVDLVTSANQEHVVELREFERALAAMEPGEREILVLAGLESMAYSEIADVLGIAVGTVKSRVARARTKLRALHAESRAANGRRHARGMEARLAYAS